MGWIQFESIGDTRQTNKDYKFQLPFLQNFKLKVCQSSDGPQFSHSNDKINAVDFCGPEKTPIAAAKDGTVIEVIDNNTEQGNNQNFLGRENKIRIIHKDGLISEYAHIVTGSAYVKVGDYVKAGQKIALLGKSFTISEILASSLIICFKFCINSLLFSVAARFSYSLGSYFVSSNCLIRCI